MQELRQSGAATPQNNTASRGCLNRLAICKRVWVDGRANIVGIVRGATGSTGTRYTRTQGN
jgi:hypothetical protein